MSIQRIDGRQLTTSVIEAIADGAPVELSETVLEQARLGRVHLQGLMAERRLIYGVTTGYGPLAGRAIDPSQAAELQRNLIYHLASGTGPKLPRRTVRAIMAVRLNTLAQGHSAVRPDTLSQLVDWLNADLVPIVPARGTVGASGDLTPLAHIALAMMGEADVEDGDQRRPAAEALSERGWSPLDPAAKDGLALVNGTAAMTGIAALNATAARRALDWAMRLTVIYAECCRGRLEAWRRELGLLRPHPGQQAVHRRLNDLADGSHRLRPVSAHYLPESINGTAPVGGAEDLPQDPYTIRCAPQLFGAIQDSLDFHDETVDREINSVTDNPIFMPETDDVIHGGNFYGQHVAFVSDALNNALVKIAVHSERMIARITDEAQNGDLPAFLQGRDTGLHSGFMGAQVSASALVAEMRTLVLPASVQSIPTNANNQDVVTMGTIAARKSADILEQLQELQAITALIMAQAMELTDTGLASFAPASRALHGWVRDEAAPLAGDRPLHGDIAAIAERLRGEALH